MVDQTKEFLMKLNASYRRQTFFSRTNIFYLTQIVIHQTKQFLPKPNNFHLKPNVFYWTETSFIKAKNFLIKSKTFYPKTKNFNSNKKFFSQDKNKSNNLHSNQTYFTQTKQISIKSSVFYWNFHSNQKVLRNTIFTEAKLPNISLPKQNNFHSRQTYFTEIKKLTFETNCFSYNSKIFYLTQTTSIQTKHFLAKPNIFLSNQTIIDWTKNINIFLIWPKNFHLKPIGSHTN